MGTQCFCWCAQAPQWWQRAAGSVKFASSHYHGCKRELEMTLSTTETNFGSLWTPFMENEGRKILPPKGSLVRRQQDAAAAGNTSTSAFASRGVTQHAQIVAHLRFQPHQPQGSEHANRASHRELDSSSWISCPESRALTSAAQAGRGSERQGTERSGDGAASLAVGPNV